MPSKRPAPKQVFQLAWNMLDVRYGAIALLGVGVVYNAASLVWRFKPDMPTIFMMLFGPLSVIFHSLLGGYVFFLVAILLPRLGKHYERVEAVRQEFAILKLNCARFREDTGKHVMNDTDALVVAYAEEGYCDETIRFRIRYDEHSDVNAQEMPIHQAIWEMALLARQKGMTIRSTFSSENTKLTKALNDLEFISFRVLNSPKTDSSYPRLIGKVEALVKTFFDTACAQIAGGEK